MQTTIKVRVQLCHGNDAPEVFTLEGKLPTTAPRIIDNSETAIVELFYPAMRQALKRHLEDVSHRATRNAQAEHPETVIGHALYRVDGQVGRVVVPTYTLQNGESVVWNSATELFGPKGPGNTIPRRWLRREFFASIRGETASP